MNSAVKAGAKVKNKTIAHFAEQTSFMQLTPKYKSITYAFELLGAKRWKNKREKVIDVVQKLKDLFTFIASKATRPAKNSIQKLSICSLGYRVLADTPTFSKNSRPVMHGRLRLKRCEKRLNVL